MLVPKVLKTISLDVTGTILRNLPIGNVYSNAALMAKLTNPPLPSQFEKAFRTSFKENFRLDPCYGNCGTVTTTSREWWVKTVRETLQACNYNISSDEFQRFFRKVYQAYASIDDGFENFPDSEKFLLWATSFPQNYSIGILTNSPMRTIETTLPASKLHKYFNWYVSCEDIKFPKPHRTIFDRAYNEAKVWRPDLERQEILHIGDNLLEDYAGARNAGFQAIFLNRKHYDDITLKEKWTDVVDKMAENACNIGSESELLNSTFTNLAEISTLIESSRNKV